MFWVNTFPGVDGVNVSLNDKGGFTPWASLPGVVPTKAIVKKISRKVKYQSTIKDIYALAYVARYGGGEREPLTMEIWVVLKSDEKNHDLMN